MDVEKDDDDAEFIFEIVLVRCVSESANSFCRQNCLGIQGGSFPWNVDDFESPVRRFCLVFATFLNVHFSFRKVSNNKISVDQSQIK